MREPRTPVVILLADDDEENRVLAFEALAESRVLNETHCVTNGEELWDYLHRRGKYVPPVEAPWPGINLLDLNMPKKDGRETLREIKADPEIKADSRSSAYNIGSEDDILRSYDSGTNSFISKPVTFGGFVEVMKGLSRYWFEIVDLPRQEEKGK
ncbi:MAG TPA: response regulator [Pyrinomonadaceae bacterium]|jgi:CheY-like chemotaxis protein